MHHRQTDGGHDSSSRHNLRPVKSATYSAAAGRSEQLLRPDMGHQTSPAAGEHKYCHMGADGGCTWQANVGQTGSRCDSERSARSCRSGGSLASARLAPRHGMAHTNFNSSDHGATTAGRHVPCKDFTISTTTGPTDYQRLPTVSSRRGKPNAAAQWPSDASMQRQQPRPATRGARRPGRGVLKALAARRLTSAGSGREVVEQRPSTLRHPGSNRGRKRRVRGCGRAGIVAEEQGPWHTG